MITIYRTIGGARTEVCKIADENASHACDLMGKDEVTAEVTTEAVLPVQLLDYMLLDGVPYTLNREPELTKRSEVEYRYRFTFEAPLYNLLDKGYMHPMTRQSRFTLTGTLRDFVELAVSNANEIDPGWSLGEVPETARKNLAFDGTTCGDALNRLANEFSVEYHVTGKRIDFYERYETLTALEFEQGMGRGLYALSRKNVDSDNTITRAILFGGTQNLPLGYRSGSEFLRWADDKGNMYVENFDEYSKVVERDVYFDDVYPHFEGKVESVRGENHQIVKCPAIDFDLNAQLIGGVAAKINFITGDLSGCSFELTYDHAAHEVTLIRQEDVTALPDSEGKRPLIPNANRKPGPGDEINFSDIAMPQSYVTRAEEILHTKGVEWLNMHAQLRVKFALEVDYRYLRRKKIALRVGDVVRIKTPEAGIDRLLRIISLSRSLHTGSLSCDVSNYPRYSWEKELDGKIQSAKDKVELLKSEVLYDINATKSWVGRNFARLFGGNKLIGKQEVEGELSVSGDVTVGQVTLRSVIENLSDKVLWLRDKVLSDNIILKLFRVHASQVAATESISSENYVSGAFGQGAAVRYDAATDRWVIEGDSLHLRESFHVPELVLDKIRAVKGAIVVSAGGGKVASVEEGENSYTLTLEDSGKSAAGDGNPFVAGDFVRCQVFTGSAQKFYWVTVQSVTDRTLTVSKSEFNSGVAPEAGDEIVQLGHLRDRTRQGAIYITASDSGAPMIDVLDGISTRSLEGRMKVRQGNLSGITTYNWGQLSGYGLYGENVYLTGDFRLRTGEDVRTRFDVLEGKFQSAMQSVVGTMTAADNYLKNAVFADDMAYWERESDINLYDADDQLLEVNDNFYSEKNKVADLASFDGRLMLRIKRSFVRQLNREITRPEPGIVLYLTVKYHCAASGTLSAGFEGSALYVEKEIEAAEGFQTLEVPGEWNGTGDFVLKFTGDIHIEALALANHPLDDYKKEVKTKFEQTAESISAVVKEVDKIDNTIKTAGWITEAEGSKLWASTKTVDDMQSTVSSQESELKVMAGEISATSTSVKRIDADLGGLNSSVDGINNTIKTAGWITKSTGNELWAVEDFGKGETLISRINQTAKAVTIEAKHIQLEGKITANGGFKIDEDGNMEAVNGKFSGSLSGATGTFSGALSGVSGSFESLDCLNRNGDRVGGISFDESGMMAFDGKTYFGGDVNHNGTIDGRSLRFLASDLWCRKSFGAQQRNTVVVEMGTAYYYTKGLGSSGPVQVSLQQQWGSGVDYYYELPLYGNSNMGDASGFPVELVLVRPGSSSVTYNMIGMLSQRVTVISLNDRNNDVAICWNGRKFMLDGGSVTEFWYIGDYVTPAHSGVGKGWMVGSVYDNNWS